MQPNQIVHESEAQRQFIRLQLPAQAVIDGKKYTVKDLSSGGIGIREIDKSLKKGQSFQMELVLPFLDFSLDISLTAQVQYQDKKLQITGCRFVDLSPTQVSILNHIIKSFIAGDIVSGEDVLAIASRENFVNVRKHKTANAEKSQAEKIKEYGLYGVLSVVALAFTFFIISNIFERMFILKSVNGSVQIEAFSVDAPGNGIFANQIPAGSVSVSEGQVIATLSMPNAIPGNPEAFEIMNVKSPCDCFISEQYVQEGEFRTTGAPIFKLIPSSAKPWVATTVEMTDAHKIKIGTNANLKIAGTNIELSGKVQNIQSNDNPQIIGVREFAVPVSTIIIQPDQPILADNIGRPVFVEFLL